MDNKVSNAPNASTNILYDVIPETHPARTLVLCFDGTGDCFDADNSNVVQFFSALQKDDKSQQMVYYQAGIGTYTTPQIATPLMAKLSKTLDMMIAWNLDAHVMGGYEFLMQNYKAGDKICIFGFSRGAYTARALAGMVHKVGLLPSSNHQQVPFAYKMFSRNDDKGWRQSKGFKKAFSMDVDIEFIGVWDTVASVGLFPHSLPFTSSNRSIKTFRHALSLDEHRAKFKANLYHRPTDEESKQGTQLGEMPKSGANEHGGKHGRKLSIDDRQDLYDMDEEGKTDVLEVWFAGCHCDIGGGSVENDTRHTLARIPLRWMIRECFKANTGILFHKPLLVAMGLDPGNLYPTVKERPPAIPYTSPPPGTSMSDSPVSVKTKLMDTMKTLVHDAEEAMEDITGNSKSVSVGYANIKLEEIGTEEEEDLKDALSPIYDQLKIAPYWWVLEMLPVKMRVQSERDNSWKSEVTMNVGRGRIVPEHRHQGGVKIHRTVKIRLDAGTALKDGPYRPNARNFKDFEEFEPTWVD